MVQRERRIKILRVVWPPGQSNVCFYPAKLTSYRSALYSLEKAKAYKGSHLGDY
jgi:hypothetical protein